MKCLSLVVNKTTKRDLVELLADMPEVSAYTVFHGEGHYIGNTQPFESAQDEVMGFVPRIRIDLFLEDKDLDGVIRRIKECSPRGTGRGLYWVSAVDSMGEF